MADFSDATAWVKQHPYVAGATVFGGGLALLWLFGFFSGGSQQTSSGGGNAAAFYAAEAAQTQAGAAIQIATLQTASQTAQTKIGADTAAAINSTNAQRDMTINQQNVGRDNTVAGYDLQATMSNNATVLAQTQSNNATAYATDYNHQLTAVVLDAMHGIIPQELALTGGWAGGQIPGFAGTGFDITTGAAANVNNLMAAGYTREEAINYASGRPIS